MGLPLHFPEIGRLMFSFCKLKMTIEWVFQLPGLELSVAGTLDVKD